MADADSSESEKNPDAELLRLAKLRWQQGRDALKGQRERELADLRFYAGDQWPSDVRTARAGQTATASGLPPVPARPCLTINKTIAPVRTVLNEERQSDMGIEIVPADDFSGLGVEGRDDDEIEVREGLTRRIQRMSEARDARTWGFERGVIAGTGYWAVSTRFAWGKTFDQDVYVRKFYNQSSVVLDPAHEQSDGSDAEWAFIGTDMTWDAYRAEFPKAKDGKDNPVSMAGSDEEFRALGDEAPDWFTSEGDTRMCRVVEYFYTERESRELALMPDGSSVWVDELPEGMTPVDTRHVIEKTIKWCKIDGLQVLEETDWPGPDMPIVKYVAEELQPYDGERRAQGMVRPMREPGEGFNYMISKQVETIGLTPISPLMHAEGQIEGYESWYDAANTRAIARLPYKQTDIEGRPAPPPFRPPVAAPIEAIAQSVAMFDQMIQSVSVHDASLGKAPTSLRSGKAIDSVIQQDRQGTSNYLDNLARSIRYEGQIINGLLYPIYGTRPGRLARIIDGEGNPQTVALGQAPQAMMPGQPQQAPKVYKLTEGFNANVVVKVSKDYDTRSEQQAAMLGQILSADPALMQVFGDIFFGAQKNLPGYQELEERMKLTLLPAIQAGVEAKKNGGQPMTPQMQQAMQQMQQLAAENQALKQALQGRTVEKQMEGQNKLQVTAVQEQAENERNRADNETRLAVAALGSQVERLTLFLEERARLGIQQADADAAHLDRAHEVGMAAMNQGHSDAQQDRQMMQEQAEPAEGGQ